MSAPSCIVYYGLRFEVEAGGMELLQSRSDPRMKAARNAGLTFYWGEFAAPDDLAEADENRYLLFVGSQVAVMGPEDQSDVSYDDAAWHALTNTVRTRLKEAGFEATPRLYLQWQCDR